MARPEPCYACSADGVARCEDCGRPVCAHHRRLVATELGQWSRCRACDRRLAHENSWAGRWARRHQSGSSEGVAFLHVVRLGILAVFALAALLSYLARIL